MTTRTMNKLEWQVFETRLQRAREAAEEIAARMHLTAPVEPLQVADDERHMLRVKAGDFRDRFDGQLEFHPGKRRFILFYNTKYDAGLPAGKHHPRTRFSVGHELGHYFLERHRAYLLGGGKPHPSRGEFSADVAMEREADAFASGLLMPSKLARPLVNEQELSLARIEEIADYFQVSMVSAALRSVQLSDFPCAVAGIRDGSIAWSFRSQALIDAGLYPPESGTYGSPKCREQWAAFQAGTARTSQAPASGRQWFRVYDREELGGVHVTEHYLPVPTMGTLIVLLTVPEDELQEPEEELEED